MLDPKKPEVEPEVEPEAIKSEVIKEAFDENHPEKSKNYSGKVYNPKTKKFTKYKGGRVVKS